MLILLSRTVTNLTTRISPIFRPLDYGSTNIRYYSSAAFKDLSDILKECDNLLDGNEGNRQMPIISRSESVLDNVAQDASSYSFRRPDICIVPSSVVQIQKCVKYCYKHGISMVPVGARTGLEGGIHAMRGGVSFDLSQMKDLLEANLDDMDCHVQAGLSWRELNEQLRSHGLWFPVDPGASATLGGMASTSASGTNAVKFGTMRENVIGLELVVGPEGELISTSGKECRTKKSSAGLNLTNLFVGSEGTLGIISSVRLRLHALPACLAVATVAFPSVQQASDSVVQVMQCGIPVARLEFLDVAGVQACYQDSKLPNLVPECPMLFVELHALSEKGLEDQIELLKEIFDSHEAREFQCSSKQEERSRLWAARHNLHWSILKTKPGFKCIDTDVCVPISKFPQMVSMTHELIERFQLDAPLMGHAGDGNFHSVILYDPNEPAQFARAKELATEMGRVAIKLDGTVTGEHGVGRGKMELIEEQFDDQTLAVMYAIKSKLDPKNLFNPEKVFKARKLENFLQ